MGLLDSAAIWGVLFVIVACVLVYMQAGWLSWGIASVTIIAGFAFHARPEWWIVSALAAAFALPFCALAVPRFRRPLISDRLRERFENSGPRPAAESAPVWSGSLFTPGARWRRVFRFPRTHLTTEEQEFIAGPVDALCRRTVGAPEPSRLSPFDPATWPVLAEQGLLGLDLPPELGGRGFSPVGVAAVVEKIASRDLSLALCVGSPAAAMARSLLRDFASDQQRQILAAVARGKEILTLVSATSPDGAVAGMPAGRALVRRDSPDGATGVLGLSMDFEMHCVELAPVASLFLVVLEIDDPNNLLGDGRPLRRAVVMVPADLAGVCRGRWHDLSRLSFPYGTVSGHRVNVPVTNVLGGPGNCELVAARLADISPWALFWSSVEAAAAKVSSRCAGAVARISGVWDSDGNERMGVAGTLGRMAVATYALDASRRMVLSRISQHGIDPALASLLRLLASARSRTVMNTGLDVHGVTAICQGPANLVAEVHKYPALAASLGGNVQRLRSRYVFQRMALAQHPYLAKMLDAAGDNLRRPDVDRFDRLVGRQLARVSNRFFRAVALGWSGALLAPRPSAMKGLHRLARQASRLSEAAALTVELMLVQKGRELLADSYAAARLADVSAEMFAVSAVLRRYHLGGQEESERPLAKQALVAGIANAQFELRQLLENNAPRWLHATVRCAAYPYGWPFMAGTDMAELRAAQALVVPSTVRDRLTAGIFLSSDKRDSLARLENALSLVNAVAPLAEKLRSGERVGLIQGTDLEEKLASAEAARLLAASDAQLLREAEALRREVMAMEIVDVPAGSVDKKRTQA